MKISVKQIEGMTFLAKGESGHWIPMDNSHEAGGQDGAVRPMELILIGLAGCTSMDVVSILKKMKVKPEFFSVEINADRADSHPRVFTAIHIQYRFTGDGLDESKLRRAVELSVRTYCPVSAMLSKTASIDYNIIMEETR